MLLLPWPHQQDSCSDSVAVAGQCMAEVLQAFQLLQLPNQQKQKDQQQFQL
jgi:hypothetical protein